MSAIVKEAAERVIRSLRAVEPQGRSRLARVARVEPDQLDRVLDSLIGEKLARKQEVKPSDGSWPFFAFWLTAAGRAKADALGAEPEPARAETTKQGKLF